jgi:hypothetical protein
MTEEEAEAILRVLGLSWYYADDFNEYWLVHNEDVTASDSGGIALDFREQAGIWIPKKQRYGANKLMTLYLFLKGKGRWVT